MEETRGRRGKKRRQKGRKEEEESGRWELDNWVYDERDVEP